MRAQWTGRSAILVFTSFTILLIGLGTYIIFGAWFVGAGTEAPGDAWLLVWPLVWLLSGVTVTIALSIARRLKVAMQLVAWVWGSDILLWIIGVPLANLLGDTRDSSMLAFVSAFDVAALYTIGRFLLRGGPHTIWGH